MYILKHRCWNSCFRIFTCKRRCEYIERFLNFPSCIIYQRNHCTLWHRKTTFAKPHPFGKWIWEAFPRPHLTALIAHTPPQLILIWQIETRASSSSVDYQLSLTEMFWKLIIWGILKDIASALLVVEISRYGNGDRISGNETWIAKEQVESRGLHARKRQRKNRLQSTR